MKKSPERAASRGATSTVEADYVPGSRLVFSWAGELRYFRVPPGLEPLASGHGNQPLPASR